MSKSFAEYGIEVPFGRSGEVRAVCPECAPHRKPSHQREKDLAVNVDEGVWHCHHCGWAGSLGGEEGNWRETLAGVPRPKLAPVYTLPAEPREGVLPPAVVAWFARRGIPEWVLADAGITAGPEFDPNQDKLVTAIRFPYRRGGALVNIKYRAHPKSFWMAKGAERILYGLDDIAGADELVIVEGEMDKLTIDAVQGPPAVSVPDGAPAPNATNYASKFAFLSGVAEAQLRAAKRVLIGTDMDEPGERLAEELARRIGYEKCARVQWPEGCKDANETLVTLGREAVCDALAQAEPYPVPQSSRGDAGGEAPPRAWDLPTPLPEGERPEFPVEKLPEPLGSFADALATATQTPTALAGFMALGATSIAAAKRTSVLIRDGWVEPLNTFFLVALASGNRKTAVVTAAGKALRAAEAAHASAMQIEIARAQARRTVAEKRLDRIQKQQANEDDPAGALALQAEAERLIEDLIQAPELRVPVAPRYLVDDITPERLADLMAEHGGRMGVLSAEGGIFQVIAGRYSEKRADSLDLFLKGHAGDDMPIDRVGRQTKHLIAPALTLALAVQPDVLAGLAAQPGFRGRGLLARYAFACPASTVGCRQIAPPPVPKATDAQFSALINAILQLPEGGEPLTFSSDASASFMAFERALEPRLGPDGDLEHLADWGAKLAGLVARLAGLLHLVKAVTVTDGTPTVGSRQIESTTVQAAVDIANTFLIPHAKTAFALMGADPALDQARHVLRVLRTWPNATVSRRDLHQRLRARFPRPEELDRPLALLVEHGYLRRAPAPAAALGRRPSPQFDIHPEIATQNPQNTQNPSAERHFEDSVYFEDGPSAAITPDLMPSPNGVHHREEALV